MIVWWIGGALFFLLASGIVVFNGLIIARNQVRAAWSDIDVQLTRRHDLVPQLVTTVKAYADYEKATLTTVTELRTRAEAAASLGDRGKLEGELGQQIDRILALQESYPELKASKNFLALQRDLVDVEDHLQYARRFYNGAVRDLNTRIEQFPDLIVARIANFHSAEFFQDGTQGKAPA